MEWSAAFSLLLLTACGRDQLSLPVAQAASSPAQVATEAQAISYPVPSHAQVDKPLLAKTMAELEHTTQDMYRTLPSQNCYAFMLHRPRAQRALAVQARLQQADRMSAALDSEIFSVDLMGDHANVLSLEFPLKPPAVRGYAQRVNAVVVEYLSAPEIQDYLCNAGFSEVKLSARDLNDGLTHLVWKATVTSEGLLRVNADGRRERLDELVSVTPE